MSFRKRPCNQLIEVSLTRVSRKKACDVIVNYRYHKIPKKSPGAYIFRGLFLRSLSLVGLMFAGGGGGGGGGGRGGGGGGGGGGLIYGGRIAFHNRSS